jgi:hypothetical protein
MGCYAMPQVEKMFEGKIWSRSADQYSFSVWGLKREEERVLEYSSFHNWLGEQGTGYTEIHREEIENYWTSLRPEERYRVKDFVSLLLSDMEEYGDGDYIQYNVG